MTLKSLRGFLTERKGKVIPHNGTKDKKDVGEKKRKKFPACRDGGEIQWQGRLHGAVWEAAGEE